MANFDFEVYEDNGGGLHLFVFGYSENEPAQAVYAHSGYECLEGNLRADVLALFEGADPDEWDGAEENPQALYDNTANADGVRLIADSNGIYPQKMRGAGKNEFFSF